MFGLFRFGKKRTADEVAEANLRATRKAVAATKAQTPLPAPSPGPSGWADLDIDPSLLPFGSMSSTPELVLPAAVAPAARAAQSAPSHVAARTATAPQSAAVEPAAAPDEDPGEAAAPTEAEDAAQNAPAAPDEPSFEELAAIADGRVSPERILRELLEAHGVEAVLAAAEADDEPEPGPATTTTPSQPDLAPLTSFVGRAAAND